jgi:uncharacterized protein YbaR (Trm112 family)
MTLPDRLLEIIVCPKCKAKLEYNKNDEKLVCNSCRLQYRIEDSIPVLLIEEAESF